MARFTPRTTEREMRSALWDIKESEYLALGRVGRAVNAAARDFAREAAQLENGVEQRQTSLAERRLYGLW